MAARGGDSSLFALVERVVSGDHRARDEFWVTVEPTIRAISGKWSIVGRLCERDDERTNIELKVMEALLDRDCRRLRLYMEARAQQRAGTFRTWLVAVARNLAIDYVRAHPEYSTAPDAGGSRWVRHDPLPQDDLLPVAPADPASRLAASRMLDYARDALAPEQLRALLLWLEGNDDEEIASEMRTDAKKAHQLVRAALERLRRKFRAGEGKQDSRRTGT